MAARVDFYQLGGAPLERVLPRIAERVLADGGRLLVVTGEGGQAARLDQQLWSHSPASFLPHGRAGDGHEAEHPLLIADAPVAANGARAIAIVDGRWRDEALAFERTFFLFDEGAVEAARAAWRALGAREAVERRYWRQDADGRWEQQG